MKRIVNYNHLFFTEESKDGDLRNIKFWNLLADFDQSYPEADLTVIYDVKRDPIVGKYVEYLDFQCNQESEKQQVLRIYNQHYYGYPLEFLPYLKSEPTDEEVHSVPDKM